MENLEWKLQGKSPLNKVLNVKTQKEDLISLQSINVRFQTFLLYRILPNQSSLPAHLVVLILGVQVMFQLLNF
jgi:hypothetical protein